MKVDGYKKKEKAKREIFCGRVGPKAQKQFDTGGSTVVTDQSTNPAQRCLTSQCWWEGVFSPCYDRTMFSSQLLLNIISLRNHTYFSCSASSWHLKWHISSEAQACVCSSLQRCTSSVHLKIWTVKVERYDHDCRMCAMLRIVLPLLLDACILCCKSYPHYRGICIVHATAHTMTITT